MKPQAIVAGGAAALLVFTACSSEDSSPAAAEARVTVGTTEVSPVASVECETAEGITTINIDAPQKTTVVVTDADVPELQSVTVGEPGDANPSLIALGGLSSSEVSRDGNRFTVKGTGTGSQDGDPAVAAELPFEIEVTCP